MECESSTSHKWLERVLQNPSSEPHSLPLKYLREITENFSDEQLIGKGGFGNVYKGVVQNEGIIAVKKFTLAMPEIQENQFKNEVNHLMKLKHPNIVQLVGYCSQTELVPVLYNGKHVVAEMSERLLCLEYLRKGSLREHLSVESSGFDWDTRYKIIEGICYGLHYVHEGWKASTPVIHMDLKPANILLDDNMVPKIADFGMSRLFGYEQTRICTQSRYGTLGYMAPEYLNNGIITKKLDVFSLGVIIIEIITGRKEYPSPQTKTSSQKFINAVIKNWENRLKQAPSYASQHCQQIRICTQIGLDCVKSDREERPTTCQIIKLFRGLKGVQCCNEREVRSIKFGVTTRGEARPDVTEVPLVYDYKRKSCINGGLKPTSMEIFGLGGAYAPASFKHSSVSLRKAAAQAASNMRLQRQASWEPSVAPRTRPACCPAAGSVETRSGVPVFVMMPLDTVSKCGCLLNRRRVVQASLAELKSAGVEGVMVEVWWGIAESEGPGRYNFAGYMELMEMARKTGLKVQAVMSFHQCGGNLGDSVTIPLPWWAVEEMERDLDLCYTDQWGRRDFEYVSLGCDAMPVLKGRTPVKCYTDFMRAFRDHFADFLGNTIVEIQVGMGPAGELRYPSYPERDGTWRFPGIGAFQCNDRHMRSSLKAAAKARGKPEWGFGAPTDAGGYQSMPEDTLFFRKDNGGWSTEYGDFFLSWYSGMLLEHGDRVLSGAASVFGASPVEISVKVAGIHWHYGTRSHAAELTAGYYNTRYRDGYLPIARALAHHGAVLNITCVEMRDYEQPQEAQCRPEALVQQVGAAARDAGIGLAGVNALPRYDETAHDQVVATTAERAAEERMVAFTYLRMGPDLFHPDNWRRFAAFVRHMSEPGSWREAIEREARGVAQATHPLVHEAALALRS